MIGFVASTGVDRGMPGATRPGKCEDKMLPGIGEMRNGVIGDLGMREGCLGKLACSRATKSSTCREGGLLVFCLRLWNL